MKCCALIERIGAVDYFEDCDKPAKYIVNGNPYCGNHIKSFKAWERRMEKLNFPYKPYTIERINLPYNQ